LKLSANYLLKYRHKITEDAIDEKLRQILMQADLLSYSVHNISKLRKAEKDKIIISKTKTNLIDLLQKEIAVAEKKFNNSHKIEFQCSETVLEIETDEDIFHDVFSNILDNAFKFSPGKQRIVMTLKKYQEFVEVEIKDEGIGIAADEINNVFDSFYRGSNATHSPGMGLGLALVKQGVAALNIKLQIESQINKGTSVRVEIPRS